MSMQKNTSSKHSVLLFSPALLWLIIFFAIPMLIVTGISFFSRGDYGELQMPLTLENYKRLVGFGSLGFDSLYPAILFRSLALGALTAMFCLIAGLPLAFFIARLSSRWKTFALILIIIPIWTNLLIRTYAWQILLAPESWTAKALHAIGIGTAGEALYPSILAVCIGMVCDFLPFLVLPLYTSVEKIDWTLAEAAIDLGANKWNVMRHAIFPQIFPGLIAGTILVFLPATGQFVIPDLLGGAKTVMLGNVIQQQFAQSRDWPFGSAISLVALILVMIALWAIPKHPEHKGDSL
jgi:spermidine/putrescine transport system permease protein